MLKNVQDSGACDILVYILHPIYYYVFQRTSQCQRHMPVVRMERLRIIVLKRLGGEGQMWHSTVFHQDRSSRKKRNAGNLQLSKGKQSTWYLKHYFTYCFLFSNLSLVLQKHFHSPSPKRHIVPFSFQCYICHFSGTLFYMYYDYF